jgi:mRNA-degrading endonuclease toxin of MazEF toxin-antitoxin module
MLERGRIVYVEQPDPQGRNPKRRPCVIVTATEDIKPEGEATVVAISGRQDLALPEHQVELPWHAQGHPRTGLTKRSVAVCTWLATVPVSSIVGYGGKVAAAHLIQILQKIQGAGAAGPQSQERQEPPATPP